MLVKVYISYQYGIHPNIDIQINDIITELAKAPDLSSRFAIWSDLLIYYSTTHIVKALQYTSGI